MFLSGAICSVLCKSCPSIKIIATVYTASTQTHDNPADKIVLFNPHLPFKTFNFANQNSKSYFKDRLYLRFLA
jgi:hypothetical protein